MNKLTISLLTALMLASTVTACGDDGGDDGDNANNAVNNDQNNDGPNNDQNNDQNNDVNNDQNNDVNNDQNNDQNNDVNNDVNNDQNNDVNNANPDRLGPDSPPSLGAQIDRTGRPAIGTALMETFNGDSDAKDAAKDEYNSAAPNQWSTFASPFAASLAILDSLDTVCGNQLLSGDEAEAGRYDTLAGILADDQLYVHSARGECGTYLGLEAEIVGALDEGAGGCGGRTLDDDIIDRSYSVLAAGILTGVDDTITGNDVPNSDACPFVAAPTF